MQINKTSDVTPPVPFLCDTPLPLSIATPCIIPDSPTRKDSSQNSLEDVVIPGLDAINNSNTLCASKSIEIDPTSSNTVIHRDPNEETNNQAPDFEVSYRVVGDGTLSPNVVHIEDDTQSQIPPGDSTTTTSSRITNEKSPSLKDKIDASTPYTGNAGSTKRHFRNLLRKVNTESPISRITGKISLPKDDDVCVVADSPQPINLGDGIVDSQSSSKRKKAVISSTSSEENISSNCESTTLGNLSKRKRKRVKTGGLPSTTAKTTPRRNSPLKNKKITVEETSQSSEDENVSESDSRSYYNNMKLSKKSPFKIKTSPSVARSSRRKSSESAPKVIAWLSTVESPGLATIRKSTSSTSLSRKKISSALKDKGTTRKKKSPVIKNADFKRMLAQHIDGDVDDNGEIGDDLDEW